MTHDFYVCCEAHLREIADEAIRNALTEHVARIRADEREQAAQRIEATLKDKWTNGWVYSDEEAGWQAAVAAARGEDTTNADS